MTSKERMLTAMRGGIADHVPVTPDMSNMIPARLTGKPFWDIYLYEDPPLWLAYLDAVEYFGFDGFLDYQIGVRFPDERITDDSQILHEAIVEETESRMLVQKYRQHNSTIDWLPVVDAYLRYDPPTYNIPVEKLGLPSVPETWRPVEGKKEWPSGPELFAIAYEKMGDRGVVGINCGTSMVAHSIEDIYLYHDDPQVLYERAEQLLDEAERRLANILKMPVQPDYVSCSGSGTLVFQTVDMFRQLSLPIVQRITKLCKEAGIVSHTHSCGPEAELVRICVEETDLRLIDPLEIPPMGDCDLRSIKRRYGDRISLKGNLHTTEVMLRGTTDDVMAASKQAIDDAAEGGGFILSTGDQCGRDTPDENILAMIEVARTYGHY